MVAPLHLRFDLAVQKYMDELLDASSVGDLGDALSRLAEGFGLGEVTIFEAGKSAALYPFGENGAGERVDEPPAPHLHAVLAFARGADRPLWFDEIRRGAGGGGDDWLRFAPAWLRGNEGLLLAAPWRARSPWYFRFIGNERASGAACAVLHVAAELACRRYEETSLVKTTLVPLTARERQVMRLLSAGKTDGEAARELQISARTVRFHVDNAKRKLGVTSRAQAIVQSLRGRQSAVRVADEAARLEGRGQQGTLE